MIGRWDIDEVVGDGVNAPENALLAMFVDGSSRIRTSSSPNAGERREPQEKRLKEMGVNRR